MSGWRVLLRTDLQKERELHSREVALEKQQPSVRLGCIL
jgi:hypothetical protein